MAFDTEIKQDWIEALRSPRYKQADARLKGPALDANRIVHTAQTGFCCLGVLCDRLDPDGWEPDGKEQHHRLAANERVYLPWLGEPLAEKLGIPNHIEHKLMGMNDEGRSFEEIADYIEANL